MKKIRITPREICGKLIELPSGSIVTPIEGRHMGASYFCIVVKPNPRIPQIYDRGERIIITSDVLSIGKEVLF